MSPQNPTPAPPLVPPLKKDQPQAVPARQRHTPLLACPLCSTPPMLSVPQAVCGTRSKVWFLVGGVGCEHMRVFAPGNRDEQSPEPLIIKWNEWAGGKAAELASTTDKPLDTLLAQLRGEKYVGGNLASLPSGIGQAFNK